MKIILLNFTGGIPLGLAYLAACVERAGRCDVRIVDCAEDAESRKDVLDLIGRERPAVVGATAYTYHIRDIQRFLASVKRVGPSVLTVLGGPHPTALPEETVSGESVDVVVCGEGEVTFAELIDRVEKSEDFSGLDGIAFAENGKVIVNTPRPLISDLDTLPFPRWESLLIETYLHPPYGHPRMNKKNFINMLATRGCPFQCVFCGAADVWGRKVRMHSPQRVVQEMECLYAEHGVRSVRFVDSTFTINRAWMLEFCDVLKDRDIDLAWSANARADTLDEHLLQKMKKAKCMTITVGVESGDDNVLRIIKKRQTVDQVRKAFKMVKEVGIFSWAFFMMGCPGETKQSMRRTIDFATEIDPDQVSICSYSVPYPGTEFYDLAREEAQLESIPWEDYHHSRKVIYIPRGLTKDDIEEGKRMFCEELRPHERNEGRLDFQ